MTNEPLVSVLVPVYNMERYLGQCLKALTEQTLESLEIIAIDDGSSDASPRMLAEWAQRDPRIRVITKPNSGYGDSMNCGLEQARGRYVGIVEPDDYPDLAMFQKLAKAALKHDADVVKCNYYLHFEDHEEILWNLHGFEYGKPFDPADMPGIVTTTPSIWTGLYRREFLEREGINFRPTPGAAFQDTSFSLKVWFAAERAVLLRRPMLHYRMDNPGSSSKTSDKVYTVCDELAEAYAFLEQRPRRKASFAPWFHVDKWGKYRWNYERIAPELHEEFAERMREEYEAAFAAGEIDWSAFERNSLFQLRYLLEAGAHAFAERYPESFPLDCEDDPFLQAAPAAEGPVPEGSSPAVTVIVPVFNTEPYVGECIASLKGQTYADFEAFVVDDASTDGSRAAAEAAIAGDERFTLIPRDENRGLSAVRNVALDRAKGEYVVFLDSDDYLCVDALEQLVRRARTQRLDELYFSGASFYEDDELRGRLREDFGQRTPCDDVFTGREMFTRFEERDEFFTQAALRMVRRGLLEEHGIRFREGILHEDILFTFQVLCVAQRSSFLDEPLYLRRLRSDSIMGKKRTVANIDGHFVSLQEMKRWLAENIDDVNPRFAAAVAKRIATWREVVAHDWNNDIALADREQYLAGLSPADRADFYVDIIGSGAAGDRVRREYSESGAYRLGSALVAGPRFVVGKLQSVADRL
jgi:glycosyltransferase involved in cell wall biosynthesis